MLMGTTPWQARGVHRISTPDCRRQDSVLPPGHCLEQQPFDVHHRFPCFGLCGRGASDIEMQISKRKLTVHVEMAMG